MIFVQLEPTSTDCQKLSVSCELRLADNEQGHKTYLQVVVSAKVLLIRRCCVCEGSSMILMTMMMMVAMNR